MNDNGSPRATEIAERLSEAQRQAISAPTWSMMKQYEAGVLEPLQLGLLERDAWGHKLTPLGQQVRAILSEPSS